ncbi:THAP domain-containing protein 5-like isoform X2 [Solenopsis invicta]|uniref:THAP domain-containing protein 5-like isoform X2 n=1 Tax=Solenopsis invicta TaxID=13686 RepID=UPI00193D6DF7|nr:THAP domain-containing protein 5-like isoform X2 [Solenopsis invicta]
MVKCIVPGCFTTNSSDKCKNKFQKVLEQNIKISFHRLPKDVNRRALWLKNIGLSEHINLKKHASICSLHFKEENINRTLDKIFLRENAVPCVQAFVDDTHNREQENIKNQQNCLNVSFSSIDYNLDQPSDLETSFSSVDTHMTNKLNTGNQNDNNFQKPSTSTDEIFFDESIGELITTEESLLTDKFQDCTVRLEEETFIDMGSSPINLSENSNLKVHRSTSVSPEHLQDDKDDTIKYLKASLKEYKQKSQQTIKRLKRKIKQKSKADYDTAMMSLSQLDNNYLDVLEQIEDGEVSWKYFEQLHTIQEKERLHLTNKLRSKYLNY